MTVTAPATSSFTAAVATRADGMSISERTTTAIPTGTLTRKIQCQSSTSVRTPPSRTPIEPPPEATKPKTPIAFARSAGSVKSVIVSESATAETTAPPIPCTARAPTSISCEVAKPHAADASVKSAIPSRNSRRCPKRSPKRPPSRRKPPKVIRYAFTTHASDSSEKPRSSGSTAARRRRSSRRGRSSGRRGREPGGPASVRGSSCSSSVVLSSRSRWYDRDRRTNSSVGRLRVDARRRDTARTGTRAPATRGAPRAAGSCSGTARAAACSRATSSRRRMPRSTTGFAVALVEQPYRVAGRKSPAPAHQLDAAWIAVVEQLREEHDRATCRSSPAAARPARASRAEPRTRPARPASSASRSRSCRRAAPAGSHPESRLAELDAVRVPTARRPG